jgi:hypothetical protein
LVATTSDISRFNSGCVWWANQWQKITNWWTLCVVGCCKCSQDCLIQWSVQKGTRLE